MKLAPVKNYAPLMKMFILMLNSFQTVTPTYPGYSSANKEWKKKKNYTTKENIFVS